MLNKCDKGKGVCDAIQLLNKCDKGKGVCVKEIIRSYDAIDSDKQV